MLGPCSSGGTSPFLAWMGQWKHWPQGAQGFSHFINEVQEVGEEKAPLSMHVVEVGGLHGKELNLCKPAQAELTFTQLNKA